MQRNYEDVEAEMAEILLRVSEFSGIDVDTLKKHIRKEILKMADDNMTEFISRGVSPSSMLDDRKKTLKNNYYYLLPKMKATKKIHK